MSAQPGALQAAPFWLSLILLATRDPDDMVSMAAIRELAGCPAPRPANLSSAAARGGQERAQPRGGHDEIAQHASAGLLSQAASVLASPFGPAAEAANM